MVACLFEIIWLMLFLPLLFVAILFVYFCLMLFAWIRSIDSILVRIPLYFMNAIFMGAGVVAFWNELMIFF